MTIRILRKRVRQTPQFSWKRRHDALYTRKFVADKGRGSGRVGSWTSQGDFIVESWQLRQFVIPDTSATEVFLFNSLLYSDYL